MGEAVVRGGGGGEDLGEGGEGVGVDCEGVEGELVVDLEGCGGGAGGGGGGLG